jgi:hypothetical protein
MIEPLLETVNRIIRTGQNSNSYKFALLRALAHIASRETSNPKTISRDRLAECFVAFYWDLTLKYHVRQGTNPDKDPRVMRLIRNLLGINLISEKTTLQEFQATDGYKRLVKQVAREAFDDVLPRLHTVRGAEQKPKLYEQEGEGIRIEDRTFEFLKSHSQVITQLAIGGWVEFTEQFTSAPKLFQKIQGVDPSRAALSFYRKFLAPYSNNQCFYCENKVGAKPHADHVIPWSYVLEDKAWNLVLSCDRCNRTKWYYLPPERPFLDKLIQRNQLLIEANLQAFPNGAKVKRDFAEWDAPRLDKHIRESWHKAQADGFSVWKRS